MMREVLGPHAQPGDEFAILDVENAKLFSSSAANASLMPLLYGEANSFMTMWERL